MKFADSTKLDSDQVQRTTREQFNSEKLCSCSKRQGFLLQTRQLKITKEEKGLNRPADLQATVSHPCGMAT